MPRRGVALLAAAGVVGLVAGCGPSHRTRATGFPDGVDPSVPIRGTAGFADSSGACCWLGKEASFGVRVPRGAASIWLRLYVPDMVAPETASVVIDDGPAHRVDLLSRGSVFVDVPLAAVSPQDRTVRVRVTFGQTFDDAGGEKTVILAGVGTDVYGQ